MTIELTPITIAAGEDPYISAAQADVYAEQELPAEQAAWAALTTAQKTAALVRATQTIDAVPWAGRMYAADQVHAFPRVIGSWIYRWDSDTSAAVYPDNVMLACFVEALDLIMNPARLARLKDRHDGVASQSTTGNSESYTGPIRPLCRRAEQLMQQYRRVGAMLV